ncbi:MAG TPA: ribosome biogenesis GTP-binding protein YihA/YsxC [Chitinophagaceae bacterium]|nr:ribosome biogenesis GTP-binding protein YihA/YsxC [Chitinophagaceae bacterium]
MEITHAEYLISSPDYTKCPAPQWAEIAFIGRSNVGKSSLINMLTQRRELAKVSASPGKTQMINHFIINKNMYWVDLPGYGFARVGKGTRSSWTKMVWDYFEKRENLQTLFVLLDGRHDAQAIDIAFINKLGEKRIPFALVFTKADKENQKTVSANVQSVKKALSATWEELPPVFVTSAVKQSGRRE